MIWIGASNHWSLTSSTVREQQELEHGFAPQPVGRQSNRKLVLPSVEHQDHGKMRVNVRHGYEVRGVSCSGL